MADQLEQFAGMTPEQIQQVMHLGTLGNEDEMILDQLARAQALRAAPSQQHTTPMGATLGGMGDIVRQLAGAASTGGLRGEHEGKLGQIEAGRNTYMHGLIQALRAKRPGALSGMSDGGFDGLAPPVQLPPQSDTI